MKELDIYKLFKDITDKSKTIKRFVVAPAYGNELNKNNVGQILTDVLGGISDGVKYPLCIMFPPVEIIASYDKGLSRFKCRLFFLTTQFNDRNGIQSVNHNNNLSKQTIPMTWQDMRSCAIDFRKFFNQVAEREKPFKIRETDSPDFLDRYSDIGNDKLAGVGISFDIDVFLDCEISDYNDADIDSIII